ncbi:MAG TPA: bifunctional diaminohydroxyphosphoribosylaminopyrimidine deaminase/5-amino-6-(5-phosphoribosylamino)uracil reductase RibD, partial [Verrucomicrobiae bacterium]|nr:bifunctional diaminohydroxyphosphoribosylaminopyrimidine deaminase/5-amino-6-(5-phosphoribosylamino)uracil reductase RibD [Verrucomicrobiae bacterium]
MSIRGEPFSTDDEGFMRLALRHAAKGFGATTPNPLVGAVLVRNGEVLGAGWHKRAGQAHAEVNALNNAHRKGFDARGATLYVTLEPCSTVGRTPACTSALISAGVSRVVVGATDPNPKHRGAGFRILRKHGLEIVPGILRSECQRLNEAFNHWIVH